MSVHDTIGDFITVIRNAGKAGKEKCNYPHSNLRLGIGKILKQRGFIKDCQESKTDDGFKTLEIELKYVNGKHAIQGISRVRLRVAAYFGYREIPSVLAAWGFHPYYSWRSY